MPPQNRSSIATQATQAAAPGPGTADPPRPMPFAIARNTHEAIRGSLKDCVSAATASDTATLKAEWEEFKRGLLTHMAMEDDGMFPMMNSKFDNIIDKEGLSGEHDEDKKHQADVDAALASGDPASMVKTISEFAEHHEKHLLHEEDILMPRTMQTGSTPQERAKVVNEHLLKPMLAKGDFPWHLEWVLKKLVKHKPPMATRVYIWGLQHACTADEYSQFLPIIKSAVPEDMFADMDKEFGVGGAGKL